MVVRGILEYGLPILLALPTLLWLREPGRGDALADRLWRWRWPILLVTRLVLPVVVFVILGISSSRDMSSDYWNRRARSDWFLQGAIPGVDVPNTHAPFFPWLEVAGRVLTPTCHPVGTLLFFVLGDFLAVHFGARLAGRLRHWTGAWLLLTPALWHLTTIRGQDESLFVGLLAAALFAATRGRASMAGTILGIGLCVTKPTFAIYALTILVVPGFGTVRAWLAFLCSASVGYVAYAATGAPLFPVRQYEHHTLNWGAGVSIPDALVRLFPGFPLTAGIVLCALATGAALVIVHLRFRDRPPLASAIASLVLVHAAFLLFLPCGVSPYFVQGLVPTLLFLGRVGESRAVRAARLLLAVLALLVALHWTGSRFASAPMKPLMITFHLLLIALVFRQKGTAEVGQSGQGRPDNGESRHIGPAHEGRIRGSAIV